MEFKAFSLPKRGNSPEEWEDAYAENTSRGRFAVSDGATESVFAGQWAKSLVEQFVARTDGEHDLWADWLPRVQTEWTAQFRGREFPWYTQAKLEHGAFATFLGIVVTKSDESTYQWHAVAVGDTCLFHTRNKLLLTKFPVDQSSDFGTRPFLLGTKTDPVEIRENRAREIQEEAIRNDRLWLMTDALAEWALSEDENHRAPWLELSRLVASVDDHEAFAQWIEGLRDAKQLKNDDVTLAAITF